MKKRFFLFSSIIYFSLNNCSFAGELTFPPKQFLEGIIEKTIPLPNDFDKKPSYKDVIISVKGILSKKSFRNEFFDKWEVGKEYGDCEDFALEVKADLSKKGFGDKFLKLVIVIFKENENHVILKIETLDKGIIYFDTINGIFLKNKYPIKKQQFDGKFLWKTA